MNRPKAEEAVRLLLEAIDPEPHRNGLVETPRRVARAWEEFTAGYGMSPAEILSKRFENSERYNQMVCVGPVDFYSTCEHHLLPFHGSAWVAYIPKDEVVGLSKLARLVDCFARRLQIQERMTQQIADAIEQNLKPNGWGVVVRAQHMCMCARGAQKERARMITTALGGALQEPAASQEFMSYVRGGRDR